ncbi:MAG TPA: amidohydrolase family protein [bacterium]|mgnify:CR=1 FL=1|nr:amidohydrolase family protein [bacterium]HPN44827.1 amidohydrolase family protein [bacterium]
MRTNHFPNAGLLFIALIFINFYSLAATDMADLILYNGKIITVDEQDRIYQAIAVKDGRILQLGSDAEITPLTDPRTKTINLQGKTVTPGLIDSHYHMMYYGAQFWPGYLNIRHEIVTSKAELLQVVGDYAQQLQPGQWISGNQGFTLQFGETLDRWDLDAVAPNNPCYLRHCSGQYSVVNSAALDSAGIDRDTPNPPGSLIMKDEFGEPNGLLSHYPAENLVGKYATGYGDRTDQQKLEDIERGQQLCLQAGYTSIQDVIIGSIKDIQLYKQYADSGLLKVRLYTMLLLNTEQQVDTLVQMYQPIDSGLVRFGGWKLAMDGGLAAKTMLMYDKSLYASEISYPYHTQEEMNRMVKKLHDTGLQVAVHVGGDEGIDMTLTAFELAMQQNPRPDPRHRIEHGLFPSPSALTRMKNANIILSTQPQWITWYGDSYVLLTDNTTMDRLLPLKTMLDMDIHLAFGCDVPASIYQEPKYAFWGATMRRSPMSGANFTPAEKINMHEALRIHTMGSAYAGFAETTTGSLEPGKYADMVIWSHDLYNITPQESFDLAAEMTIVGGEILYDDGQNPVITNTNKWVSVGPMLASRMNHTATLLNNGTVLITGWETNNCELYDPASQTFSATGATLYNHREAATATLLNNGLVLLAGGYNAPQKAELYDPGIGTFKLTDSLKAEHTYHTATLLPDGRVLIAGGQSPTGPQTQAVVEIYDPVTNKFSLTDSLIEDRASHTAALLPNGLVLIAGGLKTTTPGHAVGLKSCELYDPSSGTFIQAQPMNVYRNSFSATCLNNNKILVCGGDWYNPTGELYDYITDTWTLTGDMVSLRQMQHTATLLKNGQVLITGGFLGGAMNASEIFNPDNNEFTTTDSMIVPRRGHSATLLADGCVLVTGGYSGTDATNLAELYVTENITNVKKPEKGKIRNSTPADFTLSQNYPNPFNPVTYLNYNLTKPAQVTIAVYNIRGELVHTLIDAKHSPGEYRVTWDGTSADGSPVGSGMYLVRMQAGKQVECRKVVYLK